MLNSLLELSRIGRLVNVRYAGVGGDDSELCERRMEDFEPDVCDRWDIVPLHDGGMTRLRAMRLPTT